MQYYLPAEPEYAKLALKEQKKGGRAMAGQGLLLYKDRYYIRVNKESDPLFYFFDYDTRTADINMQFQHFHTFYELCIMLHSQSAHFLEGKPYELQAYDIFGIPPNALHKTQYPAGAPCRRLIIQFSLPKTVTGLSNEFEQLLSPFHQEIPIFRFDGELQQKLFQKLNDIFTLSSKTDPIRDLSIHGKFIEFLTLIFLNQGNNRYTNQSKIYPTEEKVYSAASYIHSHYSEELSLAQLSQKLYISSYYLSHQFKQVTGFTLTDYIQMTRIRNVQSMLINTDISIARAAISCGFSSFSQFNRAFRKHIGMSPSQYRKQNKALR